MRLLVLGGTGFLGRHVVECALRREHEVTLFNRGITRPELFPELDRLRGDRGGDLAAIARGAWDAVLDTNGREPEHVRATARLLSTKASRYTFVSSVSAYADLTRSGLREDAQLARLDGESAEAGARYGALKAECERELRAVYGGAALVIRPGLIAGPDDGSGRVAYWAHRVRRGGRIAAPGPPRRRLQFVDVRDLADWIVRLVEHHGTGAYNATGPQPRPTMGELLDTAASVAGCGPPDVAWIDGRFLRAHGVREWRDLPLWRPSQPGLMSVDSAKARAAGLTARPLAETIEAVLRSAAPVDGVGLDPERERALLSAWDAAMR